MGYMDAMLELFGTSMNNALQDLGKTAARNEWAKCLHALLGNHRMTLVGSEKYRLGFFGGDIDLRWSGGILNLLRLVDTCLKEYDEVEALWKTGNLVCFEVPRYGIQMDILLSEVNESNIVDMIRDDQMVLAETGLRVRDWFSRLSNVLRTNIGFIRVDEVRDRFIDKVYSSLAAHKGYGRTIYYLLRTLPSNFRPPTFLLATIALMLADYEDRRPRELGRADREETDKGCGDNKAEEEEEEEDIASSKSEKRRGTKDKRKRAIMAPYVLEMLHAAIELFFPSHPSMNGFPCGYEFPLPQAVNKICYPVYPQNRLGVSENIRYSSFMSKVFRPFCDKYAASLEIPCDTPLALVSSVLTDVQMRNFVLRCDLSTFYLQLLHPTELERRRPGKILMAGCKIPTVIRGLLWYIFTLTVNLHAMDHDILEYLFSMRNAVRFVYSGHLAKAVLLAINVITKRERQPMAFLNFPFIMPRCTVEDGVSFFPSVPSEPGCNDALVSTPITNFLEAFVVEQCYNPCISAVRVVRNRLAADNSVPYLYVSSMSNIAELRAGGITREDRYRIFGERPVHVTLTTMPANMYSHPFCLSEISNRMRDLNCIMFDVPRTHSDYVLVPIDASDMALYLNMTLGTDFIHQNPQLWSLYPQPGTLAFYPILGKKKAHGHDKKSVAPSKGAGKKMRDVADQLEECLVLDDQPARGPARHGSDSSSSSARPAPTSSYVRVRFS